MWSYQPHAPIWQLQKKCVLFLQSLHWIFTCKGLLEEISGRWSCLDAGQVSLDSHPVAPPACCTWCSACHCPCRKFRPSEWWCCYSAWRNKIPSFLNRWKLGCLMLYMTWIWIWQKKYNLMLNHKHLLKPRIIFWISVIICVSLC